MNLVRKERFRLNLNTNKLVYNIPDDNVPTRKAASFTTVSNKSSSGVYIVPVDLGMKESKGSHTMSFYLKAEIPLNMRLYFNGVEIAETVTNEWKQFHISSTRDIINVDSQSLMFIYTADDNTESTTVYISSLKIEPGIVTNPIWTPPPEDTLAAIEALEERIAALEKK